jgi:hypothetical protein
MCSLFMFMLICLGIPRLLSPHSAHMVDALLRQVAYISSTKDLNGFDKADIEDILLKCRKYNTENGVTGVLVYHDTTCFQIVESESEVMDHVLLKIERDKRHQNIIILYDEIIEDRSFAKWAMMFRNLHYSRQMEEWAATIEMDLFNDITQIGAIDTIQSTKIANTKVKKLLGVYKRIIFREY